MEIKGRITQVEFKPGDYFRIRGMVNSAFNESRMWGADAGDGFTIGWFWFESSMPPEVWSAFEAIMISVDTELQRLGILPKRWPGRLDDTTINDEIFKFRIVKYCIFNPTFLHAKDQDQIISITAASKWFTDNNDLYKEVRVDLKIFELKALFTALENNL